MEKSAKKAFKSRNGYRSQVAKALKKVADMQQGEVPKDLSAMQLAYAKVKGYLENISRLDDEIIEAVDVESDADIDNVIAEQQRWNDETLDSFLLLEQQIKNLESVPVQAGAHALGKSGDDVKSSTNYAPAQSQQSAKVKLPKLEIPTFRGEYMEWQGFWDIYKAAVHDDVNLSKVQKFSYLLGSLKNEALDMVLGYQLSEANYDEVIAVLTERYGDTQRAKFGHFEALVAIKPASLNCKDLLRVYYECERHIRSLVALGMSESDFTIAFVPIILQKLPSDVKREVWSLNGGDEWTMANLRKFLKSAITARERSEPSFADASAYSSGSGRSDHRKPFNGKGGYQSIPPPKGSASMLVAHETNDKQRKCRYCEQPHFADQCTKCPTADSRREWLQSRKLCMICLGSGHKTRECIVQRSCYHCGKPGHHRSLCYSKFGTRKKSFVVSKQNQRTGAGHTLLNPDAPTFSPNTPVPTTATVVALSQKEAGGNVEVSFLPTAYTTFMNTGTGRESVGRALMDTASSRTHVREDLCEKLKLPVVEESYVSSGHFGSKKRTTSKVKRVNLDVKCRDGTVIPIVASVTKVISTPITRHPIDVERYPVMKQIPLAEPLNDKPDELPIDVLIGSDYYYQFVEHEAAIRCEDGPVMVGSKFGFLTAGTMCIKDEGNPENTLVLLLTESSPGRCDPYDRFGIERFWQIEDVGTKQKDQAMDVSDEQALSTFYDTLKFENGRYWVTWPWKSSKPELADNRKLAFARLHSTYNRLVKDRKLLEAYNDIIQQQLKAGITEVAPKQPTGPVYYVPHHEVLTPTKTTTKIRIVYDASSKARKDDLSLNDCMHRGIVILDDLCGLIMRFRLHKIAIVADIEKAFLQIGLQETERDVARFFWLRDINKPLTPSNVVILRFTRVYFGAISSPSLLGATLDAHARKAEAASDDSDVKVMARQFCSNRYSDNVFCGAETNEKAIRYCHEAKKMCQEASMNLREYYTNSSEVNATIPEADRGKASIPKVLGVQWNLDKDSLSCCSMKDKCVIPGVVPTKRQIVREVAQVFDPCGWFSPVIVSGKMLIQDLWKSGIGWDEKVDAELSERWQNIRFELLQISDIEIPRYIGDASAQSTCQLHIFCDASQKAAAASVYLRKNAAGSITSDLVFAKTRIAPIEPSQTIPRLELVAVELGVNLKEFVKAELRLPIEKFVVWSDSQCVLQWLRKTRLTTKFVKNRVESILKHKDVEFRYVPTAENPADLPSRGCSVLMLKENATWWHGPSWLVQQESRWPKCPFGDNVAEAEIVAVQVDSSSSAMTPLVIPIKNYSFLYKLLRVTAFVLRALRNFRSPPQSREVGRLRVAELAAAREFWDKLTQSRWFPEILRTGTASKQSNMYQLNVFVDQKGIIRCHSRLSRSDLSYEAINPILLPKNDPYTRLIILNAHEKVIHPGVQDTLAEVREMYWVLQGRSQVRKLIRQCKKCNRVEGGQYRTPPEPPLPEIRVTQKAPFAYVGLDYLGPLYVKVWKGIIIKKADKTTQTETREKVWICLFTCALTRAVHLEVVESQSADHFHLALRRFFALRGTPIVIVLDNASQFRAVEEAMSRMDPTSLSMEDVAASFHVEWRKIPETAAWMGGFYERLVGTVKRFLKKALDGVCVRVAELRTIVAEITYVVNSRPLLYVESDLSSYTLRPRDFLCVASRSTVPTYDESHEHVPKSTVGNLIANWKRVQSHSTKFWDMWKKAYLTSLREKYSNAVQRNPSALIPTIDSVVQVKDKLPRGEWRLGRVEQLNASRDGKIRSVILRLANGRTITRPLRMLYPLEMGSSDGERPFDPVNEQVEVQSSIEADNDFEGFSQSSIDNLEDQLAVLDDEDKQ